MNTIMMMRNDAGTGAGSRGGKVIGRTKSGKPIYMNHNHPSHKGFTAQDHSEAGDVHSRKAKLHGGKEEKGKASLTQEGSQFLKAKAKNRIKSEVAENKSKATHHANQAAAHRNSFATKGGKLVLK